MSVKMNTNKFWTTLKQAQEVKELDAELLAFSLNAVAAGDNQPAEALISVFGNSAKKALQKAGVGAFFSVAKRETPHEYKGVTIVVALKLKKAAKPFADMIPARILPFAEHANELLAELEAETEAKKAEAKAKREASKASKDYWEEKLKKMAEEAAKHGVKITFKVEAGAIAPAKAVSKSPTASGKETRRK